MKLRVYRLMVAAIGVTLAGCEPGLNMPECDIKSECDDGFFCNDEENCSPMGSCLPAPTGPCSEGVPCDEERDLCIPCQTNEACDDGSYCTADVCQTGRCHYFAFCDDGNVCTNDLCDEGSETCSHTPVICEDDDRFCNGVPICNSYAGGCRGTRAPNAHVYRIRSY